MPIAAHAVVASRLAIQVWILARAGQSEAVKENRVERFGY